MHIVNSIVGLINLTPLYKIFWHLLPSTITVGIILYEIGMLIFMQITYFTAQDNSCMSTAPDLYFWMMAMMSMISDGFKPAMTSSSNNSLGPVAKVLANSSRFRPATVKSAAG